MVRDYIDYSVVCKSLYVVPGIYYMYTIPVIKFIIVLNKTQTCATSLQFFKNYLFNCLVPITYFAFSMFLSDNGLELCYEKDIKIHVYRYM